MNLFDESGEGPEYDIAYAAAYLRAYAALRWGHNNLRKQCHYAVETAFARHLPEREADFDADSLIDIAYENAESDFQENVREGVERRPRLGDFDPAAWKAELESEAAEVAKVAKRGAPAA